MEHAGDGERNGAVPWAGVFDPGANVRAFTAVQREGFRAASELVDRFIRIASAGVSPAEPARSADRPVEDQRAAVFGAMDVEPLIRSWWSMLGQFTGAPTGGGNGSGHAATLDFAEVVADGRLQFDVVPGTVATAEIWLVNHAHADRGEVVLRCSDLASDRGAVIGSACVTIAPQVVSMPGRSSRGVHVEVDVAADVAPGVYRGTAAVEGYPDLWLPVAVTVRPAAP